MKYKGVGGALSVYNVTVGSTQYSASEFTLLNGPDVIQFGLMVSIFQFVISNFNNFFKNLLRTSSVFFILKLFSKRHACQYIFQFLIILVN